MLSLTFGYKTEWSYLNVFLIVQMGAELKSQLKRRPETEPGELNAQRSEDLKDEHLHFNMATLISALRLCSLKIKHKYAAECPSISKPHQLTVSSLTH